MCTVLELGRIRVVGCVGGSGKFRKIREKFVKTGAAVKCL